MTPNLVIEHTQTGQRVDLPIDPLGNIVAATDLKKLQVLLQNPLPEHPNDFTPCSVYGAPHI
jgi:hypothetical protein